MKRNPKPFSVEIKKSRSPNQHHQLLPKRLFEATPVDLTKVFQKEVRQPAASPSPAPRILPSIIEPQWSHSEPVDAVRRKRSSGKTGERQMALNQSASASGDVKDPPAEAPNLAGAVPQANVARAFAEDATPVLERQRAQDGNTKATVRKVRRKAPKQVEPATAFGSVAEPEQVFEAEVIELLPMEGLFTARDRRLSRRRTAAAKLPRHERWKRRLHSAAW